MIMPGSLAELVALCGRDAGPDELATCFLHNPILTARLLAGSAAELRDAAHTGVVHSALAIHSKAQIRAFALSLMPASAELLSPLNECWLRSIRVAVIARAVAEQIHQYDPETAWLAGLFHNIEDWLRIQGLDTGLAASILLELDAHGFVADAANYCRSPLARVRSAHMLTRIVHAAYALAGSEPGASSVEARAALAAMGMEGASAARLVQLGAEQTSLLAARYGIEASLSGEAEGGHAASMTQLIGAYSRFAIAGVFQEISPVHPPQQLDKGFIDLLRLVFGVTGTMLFMIDPQSGKPLLQANDVLPAGLEELDFSTDDPITCLAQASRGQVLRWTQDTAEHYAIQDAQVARLLQAEALLYQPLGTKGEVCAVMVLANPPPDLETQTAWQVLAQKLGVAFAPARAATVLPPIASSPAPSASPPERPDAISRDQVRRAVHEVANPLTIMRNYVNLLSSKLEADVSSQRDLKIINDEIERVSRILRELTHVPVEEALDLLHEEATNLAVNPVISELVRLSLGTLFVPNRISVQIDLDPDIPQIPANRDKLKQVLLNLAKNAVEAMPRGGRLIFATHVRADMTPPRLEISLRDNGPGLPDAVLNHLFEPVSTTKGGDHAGLGLSISRSLIKNMGGDIECDTGQNGTEFRILLPIVPVARADLKIAG
jgi:signal transduction histidine kinase